MNKYITMLLLGVVIIAMALVVGVHMNQFSGNGGKEENVAAGITETQPADAAAQTVGGGRLTPSDTSGTEPGVTADEGGSGSGSQTSSDSTAQVAQTAAASGQTSTQETAGTEATAAQNGEASFRTQAAQSGQETASSATQSGAQAGSAVASGGASIPARGASGVAQGAQQGSGAVSSKPSQAPQASTSSQQADASRGEADKSASVSRGQGSMKVAALKFRGNGMYLRLEGDSPLPAKYFLLHAPERLVVDLPGAWKNLAAPAIPSNQLIKSVRLGRQNDADRMVIDLSRKLKNHELIRINDRTVEIFFE